MAVYHDSMCKRCRALGLKLFLKGDRCYTNKCAFEKRPYSPGKAKISRRKQSTYAIHLKEKQKAKAIYGVLERQFRKYFDESKKQKGETGENLIRLLERRLDNVLFRSGIALSRNNARQLIAHGHIYVNNRKVKAPSFLLKKGDMIKVDKKLLASDIFKELFRSKARNINYSWFAIDLDIISVKFIDYPTKEDIQPQFNENFIVELYSK